MKAAVLKGSWRAAEAWYCERPGEVTGAGAASVAIGVPGLKGSWREAGAWHHDRVRVPTESLRSQW